MVSYQLICIHHMLYIMSLFLISTQEVVFIKNFSIFCLLVFVLLLLHKRSCALKFLSSTNSGVSFFKSSLINSLTIDIENHSPVTSKSFTIVLQYSFVFLCCFFLSILYNFLIHFFNQFKASYNLLVHVVHIDMSRHLATTYCYLTSSLQQL